MIILLVEDNPAHAVLVKRGLESSDLDIDLVHISDGAEALHYLFKEGVYAEDENLVMPDLILLDLKLPKYNGIEILKRIRSHSEFSNIPVIMLSSSASKGDIDEAYSNYANSYLVKPLDFSAYVELMKELGLYWLVHNKN